MPLNARDALAARGNGYAWSSSPTRGSGTLHRRNASSGDAASGQQLPRFSQLEYEKTGKQRNGVHYLCYSIAKHARRRPRLVLLVLIGIALSLALWSNGVTGVLSSQRAPKRDVHHDGLPRDAASMLDLNPRPVARRPSGRTDEKYMAYFPHSGYHNQRISLENALTVARMLDRTLLVPPVWLGHSIPYIAFDKMYHRVLEARKDGLEHCKDIEGPNLIPHECLGGYWDYTIVSWDFLVDLERIAKTQPIVERWDMNYKWLKAELGVDPDADMVKIKDATLYQYRFYDSENDTTPLEKFQQRLDISKLKQDYANTKLLHFGTLFGTTRLHLTSKENYATRSLARSSMVFKNEYLDKVSNTIMDRLGGPEAYFGVHLRLGDGVFRDNAASNAEKLFDELCAKKLGLDPATLGKGKWKAPRGEHEHLNKRADVSTMAEGNDIEHTDAELEQRAQTSVRKNKKEDPHAKLAPLARIASRPDSPLHQSLTCRKPLYTEEALLPLNTPIFLATDSNIPDKDPSLKLFFDTFPCIFTLSDLSASKPTVLNSEPIKAFDELNRLRNKDDGVPLAGFFYPLIDAMVAAKGRDMLGTPGSTFSQFAVDVLHRVYHDWPIVERG